MKTRGVRFAGLGTRVAARTFALFCVCAIVPIVISAIIADRVVRTKLREEAASHLASTSKSYGLLMFERLRQTDEALAELATLGLEDQLALPQIRAFRSSHFEIVDVVEAGPEIDSGRRDSIDPSDHHASLWLHRSATGPAVG